MTTPDCRKLLSPIIVPLSMKGSLLTGCVRWSGCWISRQIQHTDICLTGNDGRFRRGAKKARFDQQLRDAATLIDAYHEALLATDDSRWRRAMERCFAWFLGSNDLEESLYDFRRGGCHDGLHSTRINQNQVGESSVCWLLALHHMYEIVHKATNELTGRV